MGIQNGILYVSNVQNIIFFKDLIFICFIFNFLVFCLDLIIEKCIFNLKSIISLLFY